MRSSQRASVLALPPARAGPWSHPDVTAAAEGLLICALLPCSVFPIQPLCGEAPKFALPTTSQVRLLSWRATLCKAPTQGTQLPSPNLAKGQAEGQTEHHR